MIKIFVCILSLAWAVAAVPSSRQKRQYSGNNGNFGTANCECVPYWQCDADGNIITDGEGIIDLRIGPNQGSQTEQLVGGGCPNILDVCCKDPLKEPVISTPPPYQPRCGYGGNDKHDLNVRIHLNSSIHHFTNVAQFGAYPWMAAILHYVTKDKQGKPLKEDEYLNVYQCGGSLIHPQVVLTAAHCVNRLTAADLKVRLGEWDTQKVDDHPHLKHEDHYVTKVVIHEKFNIRNVFNDVALLFLDYPANLNYHIDTICLPGPGQTFVGQTCYATGWGKDNYGVGNWQAILKEIDIPVVDRHQCQNSLRDSRLGCGFCLHDSFLCAGGVPGKDTCEGDGGSPLVCYDSLSDSYVQAGIVAWGIGCGSTLPGVYVDVARFSDWIIYNVDQYLTNFNRDYFPQPVPGVAPSYEGNELYDYCRPRSYDPDYNNYKSGHPCQYKTATGGYVSQQSSGPYRR